MFCSVPCAQRDRLWAAYFDAISAYTSVLNAWIGSKGYQSRDEAARAAEAHAQMQHCRMKLHQHCQEHSCEVIPTPQRRNLARDRV